VSPRLDPQTLPSHVNRLYRAAWALCGSPHEAEDLVQETFVRVLARPRQLKGDDELAYLMRVLRNTFLDSRRTASRRPHVTAQLEDLELADERSTDRPEQALEAQELYEAISKLPEDFRLALVAVDIVGLSYGEAGRARGDDHDAASPRPPPGRGRDRRRGRRNGKDRRARGVLIRWHL
jgi:RNA polymerase sigma-70 factor (ECF subfamily)